MRGLAKTAGQAGSIECIDTDVPSVGPDEVLVEVMFAGLCGSDLGIYQFEDAYDFMTFPRIIGHEYSGRVVEVGRDVQDVSVSDRVTEAPNHGCGECEHCMAGQPNRCHSFTITGVHHDGCFTTHTSVPARFLHVLPENLTLRTAAATEPTAVATRAVVTNSATGAGDRVLVEGPGPIGLLIAQVARKQGGEVLVTGVETDTNCRLPAAADLGFGTANITERDIEPLADEFTDGRGFDVVFDATGHESGLQGAATVVRKGGQVVLVGQSGHASLDFTPFIRGEVDLQCSYAAVRTDFRRAMALLSAEDVNVERLFDDRFGLTDEGEIFKAAVNGRTIKPLFELGGESA